MSVSVVTEAGLSCVVFPAAQFRTTPVARFTGDRFPRCLYRRINSKHNPSGARARLLHNHTPRAATSINERETTNVSPFGAWTSKCARLKMDKGWWKLTLALLVLLVSKYAEGKHYLLLFTFSLF